MNVILPEDVSIRIRDFITGSRDFPYIEENELMCLLFVYGRDHRIKTETEVNETLDLVERTVANITKEIE
jgi:hypothetical protein